MTFSEALNHPETRATIDAIEDMHASLDGREDDAILLGALDAACADLEDRTGIDMR